MEYLIAREKRAIDEFEQNGPSAPHGSLAGSPAVSGLSSPVSTPDGSGHHGLAAGAGSSCSFAATANAARSSHRFGKGFRKWFNLQVETGKTQVKKTSC